jgi:hypothetical protein
MDEAGTETTGTERTGAERAGAERARTKEQGQKEQEQKSRDRESGNRRNKNGNSTIGSSNSTEAKSRRSARSKCSLGQEDEQKEDALMDTHGIIRVGRAHAVRSIRLIRSRNAGVGMSVASSKGECIESRTRRWNIYGVVADHSLLCYVLSHLHFSMPSRLSSCFPSATKTPRSLNSSLGVDSPNSGTSRTMINSSIL